MLEGVSHPETNVAGVPDGEHAAVLRERLGESAVLLVAQGLGEQRATRSEVGSRGLGERVFPPRQRRRDEADGQGGSKAAHWG